MKKYKKFNRKAWKQAYLSYKKSQLAKQQAMPVCAGLWPVVSFNSWKQPYNCHVKWPSVKGSA